MSRAHNQRAIFFCAHLNLFSTCAALIST